MKLPRFETNNAEGVSIEFSRKVFRDELDMAQLCMDMNTPMPGLIIYKNSYAAAIEITPQVNDLGAFRWYPTILIGDRLVLELTSDEIKAVMAHELAHLKRGDCKISITEAIVAMLPPPISWVYAWYKRRTELKCDALASKYVHPELLTSALLKIHKTPGCEDGGSITDHHPSLKQRLDHLHGLDYGWRYL